MRNPVRSLLVLSLGAIAALACSCDLNSNVALNGLSAGGGGSSSPVTTLPTPAPSLQGSNGFTFAATDFFVNVQNPAGTNMLLHEDGDWTQPCRATLAQAGTGVDEMCILEAEELDLYFNGTNLVWNGPQAQCAYVQVNPYYFYQFQPGIGPATVAATANASGPPTITGFTGGTTNAVINTAGEITCSADYSGQTPVAGPNCCEGSYQLTLTTGGVPAVSTVNWGGNAANCLAGPAMSSQTKAPNGFPEPTIFFLEGGSVNKSYPVAAPITKPFGSNAMVSNYFCPGGTCPGGAGTDVTLPGTSIISGGHSRSQRSRCHAIGAFRGYDRHHNCRFSDYLRYSEHNRYVRWSHLGEYTWRTRRHDYCGRNVCFWPGNSPFTTVIGLAHTLSP